MSDITAAADQTAANKLLADAESILVIPPQSGSTSFGPFSASYSAGVTITGGTASLTPPNIIGVDNVNLNYSVSLSFSLDLNDFLPHFCLPQICFFGICTPKICISWPTITIPFSFGDTITFSADFKLNPHLTGGLWFVDVVIVGIPNLQFGAVTAGILAALGVAIAAAIGWIPLIGPFLAGAVIAIVAIVGIAGLTGLLGTIITPFVSGLTFTIYKQPQKFPVLPAGGPINPEVDITITALGASVIASDKNELVLTASIAA